MRKEVGRKKILRARTYSHKCGRMHGSESQHSQIDSHFISWRLTCITNLWNKSVNNKPCPNWNLLKIFKFFWNINIKYELAFKGTLVQDVWLVGPKQLPSDGWCVKWKQVTFLFARRIVLLQTKLVVCFERKVIMQIFERISQWIVCKTWW